MRAYQPCEVRSLAAPRASRSRSCTQSAIEYLSHFNRISCDRSSIEYVLSPSIRSTRWHSKRSKDWGTREPGTETVKGPSVIKPSSSKCDLSKAVPSTLLANSTAHESEDGNRTFPCPHISSFRVLRRAPLPRSRASKVPPTDPTAKEDSSVRAIEWTRSPYQKEPPPRT